MTLCHSASPINPDIETGIELKTADFKPPLFKLFREMQAITSKSLAAFKASLDKLTRDFRVEVPPLKPGSGSCSLGVTTYTYPDCGITPNHFKRETGFRASSSFFSLVTPATRDSLALVPTGGKEAPEPLLIKDVS